MNVCSRTLLVLVATIAFSGCVSLPMKSSVHSGQQIPEGKVLVFGKVVFNPPIKHSGEENGVVSYYTSGLGGPITNHLKLFLHDHYEKDISEASAIFGAVEVMYINHKEAYFYIPLSPATYYSLYGRFESDQLYRLTGKYGSGLTWALRSFYDPLKIEVPKAKGVYIGTITVNHNHMKFLSFSVRDEYKSAISRLRKMNFGISSRDVVKRLAKPL